MALLWLDSFDHYATADLAAKYTSLSGSPVIVAGAGRRGTAALRLISTGVNLTLPAASGAVAIVGVAYKPAVITASGAAGLSVMSGATKQLTLNLSSAGFLQVYRGADTGTLLGTASVALTPATFQFVEWKATIHPSAGTVVLRVNEAVVLTLAAVNTSATGGTAWDGFRLYYPAGGSTTHEFDDLHLLDGTGAAPLNDFLGDCNVDARYPSGAGATTGWTPSAGANYTCVDDPTPNGDTDYTSTSTVGVTDTFVTQDAPVAGATLYGVQVCLTQKKDVAGTCAIAPVVRHSGTDYPGTATNPVTTYTVAVTPYGTNPGTGAAWTESGFNAAEFGYKRTA